MSDPQSPGDAKDDALAKTAGFVVFSGIAMSILKALNPLTKNRTQPPQPQPQPQAQPLAESTHPVHIPPQEPIFKKPDICTHQNAPKAPESSHRTVQIVKGDTLWGLSRKYGVSIAAIKEANGLTGDTIYAGKKLIIP